MVSFIRSYTSVKYKQDGKGGLRIIASPGGDSGLNRFKIHHEPNQWSRDWHEEPPNLSALSAIAQTHFWISREAFLIEAGKDCH
ncbi:hypothetical protein HPP92_000366 [Vanilla planifolia]|uniref:Uncharacterized protein n=1 Tax=Vanilla planifolia TaxID=51239 RepID=A0A835RW98_VANPL|nr:hypothetical protein HPP92_000366 [Vanilla planifolia]